MGELRLGITEKYEINSEIIDKHNIKKGTISPWTRLPVIELENEVSIDPDIEVKKPTTHSKVDIKKVSQEAESIGIGSDIDIKKISKTSNSNNINDEVTVELNDNEIDIKKVKKS